MNWRTHEKHFSVSYNSKNEQSGSSKLKELTFQINSDGPKRNTPMKKVHLIKKTKKIQLENFIN